MKYAENVLHCTQCTIQESCEKRSNTLTNLNMGVKRIHNVKWTQTYKINLLQSDKFLYFELGTLIPEMQDSLELKPVNK